MNLIKVVLLIDISICCLNVNARYNAISDESYEDIFIYKDCYHKAKEVKKENSKLKLLAHGPTVAPEIKQECTCSVGMTCCNFLCPGNCFCNMNNLRNSVVNQPAATNYVEPKVMRRSKVTHKPQILKDKNTAPMSVTREKIRKLITNDGEIKRILKDLVRVTMKKMNFSDVVTVKSLQHKKPDSSEDGDSSSESSDE